MRAAIWLAIATPRISKLQFLTKKILNFFFDCTFFWFLVIKTLDPDWYRIQPKMMDPDLELMNTDKKHWYKSEKLKIRFSYKNYSWTVQPWAYLKKAQRCAAGVWRRRAWSPGQSSARRHIWFPWSRARAAGGRSPPAALAALLTLNTGLFIHFGCGKSRQLVTIKKTTSHDWLLVLSW